MQDGTEGTEASMMSRGGALQRGMRGSSEHRQNLGGHEVTKQRGEKEAGCGGVSST